jgi:DNA adenine methylase
MANAPVNVSQVKQISPFRYPGGKTWLVPRMAEILKGLPKAPDLFLEPFAGGASVSMAVADAGLARHVRLVEKDSAVAAVWRVAIHGPAAHLAALKSRILSFVPERDAVLAALAIPPADDVDQAFLTILRNRVQRGGIMAPGAGLLKAGENGKGLASRWYPETLVRRLDHIRRLADAGILSFSEGDALDAIEASRAPGTFLFVDPPYTAGGKAAGQRLYALPALDHDALFDLLVRHPGPVVATYDDNAEIRRMAASRGLAIHPARMKSAHHADMTELMLTRNVLL